MDLLTDVTNVPLRQQFSGLSVSPLTPAITTSDLAFNIGNRMIHSHSQQSHSLGFSTAIARSLSAQTLSLGCLSQMPLYLSHRPGTLTCLFTFSNHPFYAGMRTCPETATHSHIHQSLSISRLLILAPAPYLHGLMAPKIEIPHCHVARTQSLRLKMVQSLRGYNA